MQRGLVIKAGPLRRTGWPWSAQVEATDVSATQTLFNVGWRAERVVAAFWPSDPQALHVEPLGQQALRLHDGRVITMGGGETMLRVPFAADAPVGLSVRNMAVQLEGGTGLRIGTLDAQVADGAVAMQASVRPLLRLPTPFDRLAEVSARLVATPPLPCSANLEESVTAWQARQGRVDPEFSVMFGPLQASGHGTAGLDRQLQPWFDAQLRLRGVGEALDAGVQAGALPQGPATAAKAVFAVLALGAAGGPVTVPARLGQGVLTVAGFPLLRVPRVAWPLP